MIRKSKYGNTKTQVGDIKFDSKKEAKRYNDLMVMAHAGQITELQRQVKFTLMEAQYRVVDGKKKCVERECTYIADFVYTDYKGDKIVEDAKGMKTDIYRLKKKMMLHFHNIQIKEV